MHTEGLRDVDPHLQRREPTNLRILIVRHPVANGHVPLGVLARLEVPRGLVRTHDKLTAEIVVLSRCFDRALVRFEAARLCILDTTLHSGGLSVAGIAEGGSDLKARARAVTVAVFDRGCVS